MDKIKNKINFNNPKLKSWLRSIQFMFVAALVIGGTFILVRAGQGYDYDRSNGEIIQNGLILVNTDPEGATITINGKTENDNTPGRFALPTGTYDIGIELSGYRAWNKNIILSGHDVEWIYYPLLIPQNLITSNVTAFGGLEFISQTNDKKSYLINQKNRGDFSLIKVSDNKITDEKKLIIPENLISQNPAGKFEFDGWAKDNTHVLVSYTIDKKTDFYLIDIGDMSKTRNISDDFDLALRDVRFINGDSNMLYALSDQDLRKLDLNNNTISAPIAKNVSEYSLYEDRFIVFINTDDGGQVQLGLIENQNPPIIIKKFADDYRANKFEFNEFDKNFYLSLLDNTTGNLTIYINPHHEPLLGQQLNKENIVVSGANNLAVSKTGQFIAIQSGKNFGVYDLDRDKKYYFSLSFNPLANEIFEWMDNYRILIHDDGGYLRIFEFDGGNEEKIILTNSKFKIFTDSSYENLYSITPTGNSNNLFLQATSLKVLETN